MPPACRKCPYFKREDKRLRKGTVIVGMCKLREKFISDDSINGPLCKDRAIITITVNDEIKKNDPLGLGITF